MKLKRLMAAMTFVAAGVATANAFAAVDPAAPRCSSGRMAHASAAELVARVRAEIAATASGNAFLELLEAGDVPRERLAWLAGEEYRIVASDRRSFSLLASRYPDPPAARVPGNDSGVI